MQRVRASDLGAVGDPRTFRTFHHQIRPLSHLAGVTGCFSVQEELFSVAPNAVAIFCASYPLNSICCTKKATPLLRQRLFGFNYLIALVILVTFLVVVSSLGKTHNEGTRGQSHPQPYLIYREHAIFLGALSPTFAACSQTCDISNG